MPTVPWDSISLKEGRSRRRSVAAALAEQFATEDGQEVVGVDASMAKGRAYLAVRTTDGQVRPCYLLLAPATEFGAADGEDPEVMYKHVGVDESPRRWPLKVARELTTWEP
jgi:hypothetical protein